MSNSPRQYRDNYEKLIDHDMLSRALRSQLEIMGATGKS